MANGTYIKRPRQDSIDCSTVTPARIDKRSGFSDINILLFKQEQYINVCRKKQWKKFTLSNVFGVSVPVIHIFL